MSKSVLILGSEGFIGGQLINYFLKMGYLVSGCDLMENSRQSDCKYLKISRGKPDWDIIFSANQFDYCINAAGSGDVNYSMTHPLNDFESNALDTIRILEAIRRNNPTCKYLHISSAAVYGNPDLLPVQETSPTHPLSPYGWHKLMSEHICIEYSKLYEIQIAIVRPFSVYGPGLKKQLFWDVFQKLQQGKNEIELWGTGAESRDFIYIDDLAKALDLVLSNISEQIVTVNVASGQEITIQEAIKMFIEHLHSKTTVRFNNKTRAGNPVHWLADISKLKDMGFRPATSMSKGLENVASWLKSLSQ